MQRLSGILLVTTVIVLGTSCGNIKNLQYMQGAFDTAKLSKIEFKEYVIQKGDLLSVTVLSDNAQATAAVTSPVSSPSALPTEGAGSATTLNNASSSAAKGFLVNLNGDIQLYKLGFVHAEGLTKKDLADTLANLYTRMDLLKNPYLEVRLLNYKITLIGEVNRPGTYTIPTERISAFEAIGLAGDITVYGKRNNVLVIRELNGVRQFGTLDLSKPDVFLSPYYYLEQNDMVIVDVAKNKGAVSDQVTVRNVTLAASVLATIAIFINIFK